MDLWCTIATIGFLIGVADVFFFGGKIGNILASYLSFLPWYKS